MNTQERLIAELPQKNRKATLIVGIIMLIPGAILLWLRGTEDIAGRIFTLIGGSMLILLGVLVCRKVEIVENCGISKAFLKKRLFYLSEVKNVEFFTFGERVVAYDAGKAQIFEAMKNYGNYAEIIDCCKKGNRKYVAEPEIEKAHKQNKMDTMSRLAVYFGIGWNVCAWVMEGFQQTYFIALIAIIIMRFFIMDAFSSSEDVALEEHGVCIENAVLVNYLDRSFGSAYPLFEFKDKRGLHLLFAREKMPFREIQQNMGKEYAILYASGKASAVKIKTEEE